MSGYERVRTATLGPAARPVAIPDDVDADGMVKASGVIELPSWVRWSGARRPYDLDDRRDRALVYEQVLTEGTDDDVRWYIEVNQVVELWSDLVLPRHVRAAWGAWLQERRSIEVC